jgi:hypothetical protein
MTHTPDSSPFAAIARYKASKAAAPAAPAAGLRRPDLTPRQANAYSKAVPGALMPIQGHALQGGKVLPPRTVRGVPRGKK